MRVMDDIFCLGPRRDDRAIVRFGKSVLARKNRNWTGGILGFGDVCLERNMVDFLEKIWDELQRNAGISQGFDLVAGR